MRLASFTHAGKIGLGVVDAERVIDLAQAARDLPRGMSALPELAPSRGALNNPAITEPGAPSELAKS